MKGLFNLIAAVLALFGIVNLIVSLLLNFELVSLSSGILNLIGAFAWYLVGEMWQDLESMGRELYKLKRQVNKLSPESSE